MCNQIQSACMSLKPTLGPCSLHLRDFHKIKAKELVINVLIDNIISHYVTIIYKFIISDRALKISLKY